jgi:creatinine amidohydrolase
MTGSGAGRRLVELSGPAAAAALGPDSVVVLPTGAIEHHGPHLPLNTDYLLADLIAAAAVDGAVAAGLDVWLLPTLSYTKSDEHSWAPGTMWLSWDTMMRTVVDLGRSVAAAGARKLVFLNGHGGNTALLQVAVREIRRQTGLQTFAMPALVAGAERPNGEGLDERGLGIHGGASETSILLHLRPDLVDLSLAERSVPTHLADLEYIGFNAKPVSFGWLSNDFGPSGVIGDPTQASAAYGHSLYEFSVRQAVNSLAEIASFRPRPPGRGDQIS